VTYQILGLKTEGGDLSELKKYGQAPPNVVEARPFCAVALYPLGHKASREIFRILYVAREYRQCLRMETSGVIDSSHWRSRFRQLSVSRLDSEGISFVVIT
jgi:hypothetical protein